MSTIIFWMIIAAIAITIDIATSNFLFAWFVVGAVMAMIAEFIGVSFSIQVIIFLGINLITIAIGYPLTKKKFKNSVERIPLMEETYIGRIMIAQENIVDRSRVKVDGVYWTVKNTEEEIKKGEKFKITGIEGNKLIIKKEV